jgi:hypothetical protein
MKGVAGVSMGSANDVTCCAPAEWEAGT